MNPGEAEASIRNSVKLCVQAGGSPIALMGILEAIKLDIYSQLQNAARQAQRSKLVHASVVPNGR